tara:strand:- start:267 stop:845 length:579 start_codon:yes stop_codon:yes gene_type:complete
MATRKTKSPATKGSVIGKRGLTPTQPARTVTSTRVSTPSSTPFEITPSQTRKASGGMRFGKTGIIGVNNPKLIFDSTEGINLLGAAIHNNTVSSVDVRFFLTYASLVDVENSLRLQKIDVTPSSLWSGFKAFPGSILGPNNTLASNGFYELSSIIGSLAYGFKLNANNKDRYYIYAMSVSTSLPYYILTEDA